ncbi:uncharacterized protein LOC119420977 isoform X3 [Nematolebias whitei]|uniref:uncharacterized protein LOC119420977 isoform X3 n=1 Tax=Nematolebias whitei TaxID=451745 RepID=UPI0018985D5C|nr:uncharacterized protein LOC119420977 isoform X3 [Nematolebias whitei]
MTPALLLWISWMYLLLDGSLGFQIAKDGSFRTSISDQNFEDDDHDLEFEGGESSANQQSSYIYTGLYTPPGAPAPSFNVDFDQNVPSSIWQPSVQYPPVNAESPSSAPSGAAVESVQGKEVGQPTIQYPPVNAESPSSAPSGTAVWYVQDNRVRRPTIQYPPVQDNQVRQPTIQYPPVNARPQSPPVAFVQGNEFDRSSRYASPQNGPSPQRPVTRQRSKGWLDFVFSNSFEDEDFDNMDFQPDNSVMDMETETIWVPAIAEEPLPLPQKPKTYIVHSKNGYKRGRVVHTKTFYSNDYKKPKIIEKVKSSKQKF